MNVNEVTLIGRMSVPAEREELLSGDVRTTWRVVVRTRRKERCDRIDTINCMTFDPEIASAVRDWRSDDVIEVVGALRRSFFTTGRGKVSTHEVEVRSARLVQRRGSPAATS